MTYPTANVMTFFKKKKYKMGVSGNYSLARAALAFVRESRACRYALAFAKCSLSLRAKRCVPLNFGLAQKNMKSVDSSLRTPSMQSLVGAMIGPGGSPYTLYVLYGESVSR